MLSSGPQPAFNFTRSDPAHVEELKRRNGKPTRQYRTSVKLDQDG